MKSLRYYIAHLTAKSVRLVMTLLRKNATCFPGAVALKIDPHYIQHAEKPACIICVTGTNGKTTVSNLLNDHMTLAGKKAMHNRTGSNTVVGIAGSFVSFSTWGGRMKYPYAILETDERSALKIFGQMTPNYLVVTNLFRDSYARNAHTDFICDILNTAIPDETTLILNSDDLISSGLKPANPRIYFSVPLQPGETEERNSKIKDIQNCPTCQSPLEPEFIRYNHIGPYVCNHCGFHSPDPDCYVTACDLHTRGACITNRQGERAHFNLVTCNIVDLYNVLAAASVLNTIGLPMQQLADQSEQTKIIGTRFHDEQIGNKRVFTIFAKATNPIATSRSLDFVRKEPGKKALIFLNHDKRPGYHNVENVGWIYDNDFTYLNDPSICQIIFCGKRNLDFALCALLSGVNESKITKEDAYESAVASIRTAEVDTIAFLVDGDLLPEMEAMYQELRVKFGSNSEISACV